MRPGLGRLDHRRPVANDRIDGRGNRRHYHGVSMEEELKAVAKVVDRLAERFPHIPRASIERAVLDEHTALNGSPIRDYVPVLVERGARGRLRGHAPASDA